MSVPSSKYGMYLSRELAHKEMLIEHYEMYIANPRFDGIFIIYEMPSKHHALFWKSEFITELKITHDYEHLNDCVMLLFKKEVETPEQRAERIFKEDEEKQKNEEKQNEKEELHKRRMKRQAVVEKHRAMLDLSVAEKGVPQIKWRRFFRNYVIEMAETVFETEEDEYININKPDRLYYTFTDLMQKAYTKNDPMRDIFLDIITEFGCFEY